MGGSDGTAQETQDRKSPHPTSVACREVIISTLALAVPC